ncbi:MAG: S8 family serine peptidase [Candidatus Eisenbacteria bacterium]
MRAFARRVLLAGSRPALLWLAGAAFLLANAASLPANEAGAAQPERSASAWTTRIDPRALRLYQPSAQPQGARGAGGPGFDLDDRLAQMGRIRLMIDTGGNCGDAQALREEFLRGVPSARWEGHVGPWAQITLDLAELPALGGMPCLTFAMLPPKGISLAEPHPSPADPRSGAIVSQGTGEIGAQRYHQRGLDGQGIRVGVVDLGFANLAQIWGTEIPVDTETRSFYQSPAGEGDLTGGGDDHGTACAEIVHDVAPGAQLYLVNIFTPVDLAAAVDWLRGEGVSVISHSIGWFFGPGDGTGTVSDIARGACEDGMLWVNAAGNQADAYWEGDFQDADTDGLNEFAVGDESIHYAAGEGGSGFDFILTWDRWPYSTALTFAVEIWEDGARAISSDDLYGATWPYAYHDISFSRSHPASVVDVRLRRVRGTEEAHLRLFRLDGHPIGEHGTAQGSIVIPADVPEVLAVGAYRVLEGSLEDFSSQGPNQAGVPKPELCGPDRVQTATIATFGGTSAACPHAAGAAALLLEAAPPGGFFDFHWTVDELRRLLAWGAETEGPEVSDGCVWGLLRLPEPDSAAETTRVELVFRVPSPSRAPLRIEFTRTLPGLHHIRLHDLEGRSIATTVLSLPPSHAEEILWSPSFSGRPATGW